MKYILAKSVEEALIGLYQAGGTGAIMGGGTDLTIDLESGKHKADTLVDVTGVPELKEIRLEGDTLVIGAAATLTEITHNPLVKKHCPSLTLGTGCVGSLQIRNSATLAGNVMSAQPAADGAMALAPYDPEFVICSLGGERRCKMGEMYAGFARSAIDPSKEMVKEIRIPILKENEAGSYIRLELRKSLSLPMLNVAAVARVVDGKVEWARITMGPVGVGPVHAVDAEAYLVGKELTAEVMTEAGKLAMNNAKPRSNPLRGSKEYREATLPILVRRALESIADQLGIKY
ncbi:MAG: FAD binding domain-containing protein [Oscillospiraceae bacterium]|nr:FAD binding domain-containing protein [Oscillospiraceae bacterium]